MIVSHDLLPLTVTNQIAFDQPDLKSISNFECTMDYGTPNTSKVSRFFVDNQKIVSAIKNFLLPVKIGFNLVIFNFFQPRSKTRAGPGHVKSRYGANGLFSIVFSPGPRPGHVKSRCRANGSFSIIFRPSPKLGQDLGT